MATYVLVKLNRLPTRVFVVLPNSGHVTNEGALAEFVYWEGHCDKNRVIVSSNHLSFFLFNYHTIDKYTAAVITINLS